MNKMGRMEEYEIKVYDNGNIKVNDGETHTLIACSDLEESLEVLKKIIINKHNKGE